MSDAYAEAATGERREVVIAVDGSRSTREDLESIWGWLHNESSLRDHLPPGDEPPLRERPRPVGGPAAQAAEAAPGEHGTPMGFGSELLLVFVAVLSERLVHEMFTSLRAWRRNRCDVAERGEDPGIDARIGDQRRRIDGDSEAGPAQTDT